MFLFALKMFWKHLVKTYSDVQYEYVRSVEKEVYSLASSLRSDISQRKERENFVRDMKLIDFIIDSYDKTRRRKTDNECNAASAKKALKALKALIFK